MRTMTVAEMIHEYDGLDGGPLTLPVEIKCPECNVFYPAGMWNSRETSCELCGGHNILICPKDDWHTYDPYGGQYRELEVRP